MTHQSSLTTFSYWNTAADGSGTIWHPGDWADCSAGDQTVRPILARNKNVAYDYNGAFRSLRVIHLLLWRHVRSRFRHTRLRGLQLCWLAGHCDRHHVRPGRRGVMRRLFLPSHLGDRIHNYSRACNHRGYNNHDDSSGTKKTSIRQPLNQNLLCCPPQEQSSRNGRFCFSSPPAQPCRGSPGDRTSPEIPELH